MSPRPRTPGTRTIRRSPAAVSSVALTTLLVTGLVDASTVEASPSAWAGDPAATTSVLETSTVYAGGTLAGRVGAPKHVKQLLTVTSRGWGSTTGTLKAWQRGRDGRWHLAHGPVGVRVGYNGWVPGSKRRQSTGTTPAGRYRLPYAFGRLADPGAHLSYRRFDRTDWWPYEPRDPSTYNVWQWHKARTTHWRSDKSEHLWDFAHQYSYAVVIGFNLPRGIHYSQRKHQWVADHRADTRRGGGIFLHVNGSGSTAGCISMTRPQMRWLVRWLRPGAHPQIVQGPYRYVTGL